MKREGPPIGASEEIAAIWEEYAELARGPASRAGVEALVAQIARLRDAQRRIAIDGAIVIDAKGNAVPHPAVEIERRAGEEVRKWMEGYGR